MSANPDSSLNGAATAAPDQLTGNPVAPEEHLKRPAPSDDAEPAHPQQDILPLDSATTRAEKVERNGDHQAKRLKTDDAVLAAAEPAPTPRQKGIAAVKPESVTDKIASPSAALP